MLIYYQTWLLIQAKYLKSKNKILQQIVNTCIVFQNYIILFELKLKYLILYLNKITFSFNFQLNMSFYIYLLD